MRDASRLLRIKTASYFGTIFDTAPRIYELHETFAGRYVAVNEGPGESGGRTQRRRYLDPERTRAVWERFRRLSVPVVPGPEDPVLDGGYTEVRVGAATFFWRQPPRGWEELARVTEELVELMDGAPPEDEEERTSTD